MSRAIIPLFICALVLAGCFAEEESAVVPERVRAIKTYTVAEPAGGEQRRLSGTIVAAETSALSFAVGGTVATVEASRGDVVAAGDVLATLDAEPLELDVAAAQSELAAAQATYAEKEAAVGRQQTLFEKGWISQAGLDQAVSAVDVAEGQLEVARSRLASAERKRSQATLTAPFDGLIASRDIEPFQEVRAGEPVFQINAQATMEVEFSIPDNVVSRIAAGAPVTVDISNVEGCGCEGRIVQIGVASETANAVSAKAVLTSGVDGLLPGMSAEVGLVLIGGAEDPGFLVPLTAIAPGDDDAPGYVFVFDPDTQVVERIPIAPGEGVLQNLVAIREGVRAGDIIASAGVSFLRDGQTVKLIGQ